MSAFIRPLVIMPFREYHRDPPAMTRHGFLELSVDRCLAAAPPLALGFAWPLSVGGDVALVVVALAVPATNLDAEVFSRLERALVRLGVPDARQS